MLLVSYAMPCMPPKFIRKGPEPPESDLRHWDLQRKSEIKQAKGQSYKWCIHF